MSEEIAFSAEAHRQYVLKAFIEKGDFPTIMDQATLEKLLDHIIALDNAFMEESGANEGAVYDDDAAYAYLHQKMQEAYPDYKAYLMRFVEDYLDYNEAYLESIGAIDWE